METARVMNVLLAEDNPGDVRMLREAIVSAGVHLTLESAWSGQEALDHLRRRGRHATATRPDVVVLDINLPILNGREVLAAMAGDDELNTIPVVILTGSRFEGGAGDLYPADRCLFAVKPSHFGDLVELVRRIASFAAGFAASPGAGRHAR
jgi:CheY-like chemotaxis protein